MENPQNARTEAPDGKATAVIPRYHLPDDWSGKGACPVCRTPGRLSVQHNDTTPDQMVCGACGTVFEVETAGTRIRLAAAPPALAAPTAGLLDAWLTPAQLLLLIDRAAPTWSSFEPLPAPAAIPSPAVSSAAKLATGPLKAKAGTPARAEAEPGTEDWFASLAAVIGGPSTIKPPPNTLLADELERALLNRPQYGANDAATPVAAYDSYVAPEPRLEPAPVSTPAVPEPVKAAQRNSADVVLAEAIAGLAAAAARATPAVSPPPVSAPAVTPPAPESAPAVAIPPAPPLPASIRPAGALARVEFAAPGATSLVMAGGALVETPAVPGAMPSPASRRELAERAWKLHELGNSLASIRGALESSGGTPDDIDVVMSKLTALEQARRERFRRTVRWALAGAALVIFVLLVIAIVLGSLSPSSASTAHATLAASPGTPGPISTGLSGTPAPGQTEPAATLVYNPVVAFINQLIPGDVKIANGPTPPPAPTSSLLGALFPSAPTATLSAQDRATEAARLSELPPWVATLVPGGLTLLNLPTPGIDPSGPPNSPCPSTSDQASALFGGPAGNWSFNHDQQGWIFVMVDKPASIKVPANMSAGYLVIGQSLELRSATGPATLRNVNFVALSCQ